ncbi:VOC family protein [Sphingobium sp. AN641]|uniref:VOC family protein n=1 Tax=Sphingobium sp. AN641 TaxID=3133443 RepID=UPI0030C39E8E
MSRYFGSAMQTAFVVRNIDDHIRRCVEVGIGPFFVSRNMILNMRCRGERRQVPITIALAYSGSMMYEYLEPHDDTPSPYSAFLAKNPEGGLHHLAYFCDDYDDALARAKSRGGTFDIVMELYTQDGSLIEIYVEPEGQPDGLLSQLIVESMFGSFFKQAEAAALEWDGTSPVRPLADLLPPVMQPPVMRPRGAT